MHAHAYDEREYLIDQLIIEADDYQEEVNAMHQMLDDIAGRQIGECRQMLKHLQRVRKENFVREKDLERIFEMENKLIDQIAALLDAVS